MRKFTVALLIIFTISVMALVGCSAKKAENTENKAGEKPAATTESSTATLKDVVQKEKEMLPEIEKQHGRISDLYKKFEQGAINRQKFNSELLVIKPEVDKLVQKSNDFYNNVKLSDNDKKDPLYADGLKNGSRLRSILSSIITTSTEGKTMINLQVKDASGNPVKEKRLYDDSQLKTFYAGEEKKYQEYLAKLKGSLEKI